MKNVVCPECGGTLTFESLCQYGLKQKVSKNGKLCKRIIKKNYGSMEAALLYCSDCKKTFDEDDFIYHGDSITFVSEEGRNDP